MPRRSGMTLVELLVVILVFALVLTILVSAVQRSRESSRRDYCSRNLQQLGVALSQYVAAQGFFPPSHSDFGGVRDHTWMVQVLPSIDEALYEQVDQRLAWSHPANLAVRQYDLPVQLCPASEHGDPGQGDYAAVYGPRGRDHLRGGWHNGRSYAAGILIAIGPELGNRPIRPDDVIDGLSSTLLLAEDAGRTDAHRFWIDPYQALVPDGPINVTRKDEIYSDHPGGAYVLFGDGRAHFLSDRTEIEVIDALSTRAGSEPILDGSY